MPGYAVEKPVARMALKIVQYVGVATDLLLRRWR